jgi:hypothetical protein
MEEVMVNVILDENKLCLVLKLLDKRYEAFVADLPEPKPMISLVHVTLMNILHLCCASCKAK